MTSAFATSSPIDFMVSKSGMSRREVTAELGLGKNLLLRMSQGRLQSVTERVSSGLFGLWDAKGIPHTLFSDEYGTLSLDSAYQAWRDASRVARRGSVPQPIPGAGAPFARIVASIGSVSAAAKLLMVPDLAVQAYAAGSPIMPETISAALSDLGYAHIHELDKAQKRWAEGLR